ncbi:MAG: xanthine phosphoribosyltransferase [Pseudomonadota bacterium]
MNNAVYHQEAENYFISWDEVNRDTASMAARLRGQGWQQIVALTEGGIGPAAQIARELDIPMIDTLSVRDSSCQQDLSMLLEHIDSTLKTLFVDDLVDTGKTARAAKTAFPSAYFVAIYAKPAGIPFVDDYITEIEPKSWVHFPWDLLLGQH